MTSASVRLRILKNYHNPRVLLFPDRLSIGLSVFWSFHWWIIFISLEIFALLNTLLFLLSVCVCVCWSDEWIFSYCDGCVVKNILLFYSSIMKDRTLEQSWNSAVQMWWLTVSSRSIQYAVWIYMSFLLCHMSSL